jgi:soluble lytic murein transglycosylase
MKYILVIRLVVSIIFGQLTGPALSEAKGLPQVNLTATHTHQKELIGAKRTLASLKNSLNNTAEAGFVNKAISQVVLDETVHSLPESYKPQAAQIAKTIIEEANKYEMDPLFLIAVIKHESYFNPEMIGLFKEVGLMQIKPDTAAWLNKKVGLKSLDLRDPVINIKLGAAFFNQLRLKFSKDSKLYIAAYNMGAANVRKLLRNNKKPKDYALKVMKNYVDLIGTLEVALMKEPFPMKVANNY